MAEPAGLAGDLAALEAAHASGAVRRRPATIVRAEGATLFDADGSTYIDCAAGHGWAALGHGHPAVVGAIVQQAARLVMLTESASNDQRAHWFAELATFLATTFPMNRRGALTRILPTNSGAEAVEGAIKFARLATGRTGFVACMRGFHGRTMGALSATAPAARRDRFAPLVPGFTHVPYNDLAAAERAVGDATAGVIVEVIQGEGGVHEGTPEFLAGLQRLCADRGALFIVDEIQTGLGRTGRWFASERHGLEPDMLLLGKALGGGIPMGAAVWRERLGGFEPGLHGSTFAGAPLACAASRAVLRVLREERLAERAARLGERLLGELRAGRATAARDVRGRGLMVGIELKTNVAPVLQRLMERGVWALPAGANVLRLLPPLTMPEDDLARATAIVQETLEEF